MNRRMFDEILQKAATVAHSKIIVIGSQAAFATVKKVPDAVVFSEEVDLCPEDISDAEVIESMVGDMSDYYTKNGVYVHALEDVDRHVLTEGWRDRLVSYKVNGVTGGKKCVVQCLSLLDVCVNKLCFGREKDIEFVRFFVDAKKVSKGKILSIGVRGNFRKAVERNIAKVLVQDNSQIEEDSITP